MRHLAAMTVLIFLALPGTASECPSRGGASPSASAQAEDIPAVHLDRVRGLSVILGRPGDGSPLVRGLTRLATAQPERYALRIGRATHPDWFASGGLSHHQVGSGSKPDKRLEAFSKRIEEFAGKVDVAAVQFSPNDLPSGTRVEVAYRSYAADMDVFVTNVGMNGSFTENILAPRIFNLGNGTGFSVREVVDAARLVTGCQIPAVESPRRAGDPPVLVASSNRIRAELGWVPEKPALEDMVSDAWNWMRSARSAADV